MAALVGMGGRWSRIRTCRTIGAMGPGAGEGFGLSEVGMGSSF